jgi:hypothetical protein
VSIEHEPELKRQVIDAMASVVAVNPDLVLGVVAFVAMIDGSVLMLHTCCCVKHASATAGIGLKQAAEVTGWHCPREG